MLEGQYPTPSQSKLFIDDIWIDDAHQIDYRSENARIPIYGYNKAQFIQVAYGKELITGNIVINYRFPNYLGHAIVQALTSKENIQSRIDDKQFGYTGDAVNKTMSRADMRTMLQAMKNTDATGRLKMLAESMDKGIFAQLSGLSRAIYYDELTELKDEEFDPVKISSLYGGFTMILTYGHITGRSIVETIEECYITGRGKSMTASSGGGGSSSSGSVIYEIYPFIAKTVSTKIVDFSQRS